jgi:hypothetical protein|uniref:Uncharacterized protein n=1 Tax=viral metagenome TaxID=1070528 RepID=A0A6C0LTX2_9ZZZZ
MKNRSNKRSKKQRNHKKSKSRKMKGGYGASNFNQLSTSHYYPLNNHNNDPSAPSAVTSDRFFPKLTGGRSRRSKKMKGGVSGLMLGSSANTNVFSNFGTIGGAMNQYNTFSGVQNVNNDIISHTSNYGATAIV